MLATGVTPETIAKNWSERSKHWFYSHGRSMDPDTVALVWGQKISRAAERLFRAREAVQSDEFRPNREKDELTYALENPGHGGRTRGYGAVPWLQSFQADQDTYRSRQRKKDEEAVDIWERNKELIRKRTNIGEHFTREIIQSIVFIFLPLGETVHLTNRSITTNPLGTKNVFRCE